MMVAVQVSVSKSENERPEHYQPLIKGDSGMKEGKMNHRKLMCWLLGHRFHTLFHQFIHDRSIVGTIKCERCGYQEDFQYDL